MISDRDIWASALLMVKRYGEDAGMEAANRSDELLAEGDVDGAATWRRIVTAIEQLQAGAPAKGKAAH